MKTIMYCQETTATDIIRTYISEISPRLFFDLTGEEECLIGIPEINKEAELNAILREINDVVLPDHLLAAKVSFRQCLADDSGRIDSNMSILRIRIIDLRFDELPLYLKIEEADAESGLTTSYKIDHPDPLGTCIAVQSSDTPYVHSRGLCIKFEATEAALAALRKNTPVLLTEEEFMENAFRTGSSLSDRFGVEPISADKFIRDEKKEIELLREQRDNAVRLLYGIASVGVKLLSDGKMVIRDKRWNKTFTEAFSEALGTINKIRKSS